MAQDTKQEKIILIGTVTKVLPDTTFTVHLDNEQDVFCYLSGQMRRNNIKVVLNDRVRVELSPYNLEMGRIIRRL